MRCGQVVVVVVLTPPAQEVHVPQIAGHPGPGTSYIPRSPPKSSANQGPDSESLSSSRSFLSRESDRNMGSCASAA